MLDDTVVNAVLISVGVIAIVVAIIWRTGSRRRQISSFSRLLESNDPERRIDAAIALTDLGLDRSAGRLFVHARKETDPAVRAGIAAAVARRQWEPAAPPGVRPLRDWAAAELARQGYNVSSFGPATTRLADMGGPRLPQPLEPSDLAAPAPQAATTPPSVAPDSAAGGAR